MEHLEGGGSDIQYHSFDQAASTPLRPASFAAMVPWLHDAANPSGAHRLAQRARAAIEEAREQIAEVMKCQPREVLFTSGGTESDNLAISGVLSPEVERRATVGAASPPPNIIVSAVEHKAILESAAAFAPFGVEVRMLQVNEDGRVDPEQLAAQIDEHTRMVSIMTVNNELGTIQPIDALIRTVLRARSGIVMHTDAVQAPLWVPVGEMTRLAHLVSLSGHKVGGPNGIGALIVREVRLTPVLRGGGQEFGIRAGTLNTAGIVGFATALVETERTREREVERVRVLRDRLAESLVQMVPGTVVNTREGTAGHLHITLPGIEGEVALIALDRVGIGVSAGASCASGALESSHVLRAIGMKSSDAQCSLRISLSFATTEAMVDYAISVMPPALNALRQGR